MVTKGEQRPYPAALTALSGQFRPNPYKHLKDLRITAPFCKKVRIKSAGLG